MKIRDLDLSDSPINAEHRALGLPPVEKELTQATEHPVLRAAMWSVLLLMAGAIGWLATRLAQQHDSWQLVAQVLHSDAFWWAVLVGLIAQAVDGALGMAYGITSTSFLLATGSSPAVASASVHIAEVFTTGASGIAHIKLGNVSRTLFLRLLLPGIAGATAGAFLVSSIDGDAIKPFVAAYLLGMGLFVLSKAFRKRRVNQGEPRHVAWWGASSTRPAAAAGARWSRPRWWAPATTRAPPSARSTWPSSSSPSSVPACSACSSTRRPGPPWPASWSAACSPHRWPR
jgi:hypothetical protein